MPITHEQYLDDLGVIALGIPGCSTEHMRTVTEHLSHWTECASCSAEAREELLPNAETAFRSVLESWWNRNDCFPFLQELEGLSTADIVSRWPLFALFQVLLHKWEWKRRREMEDADASLGARHPFVAINAPLQELVAGFLP